MAYLSPFKNDIFISYARVDDQKDPDKDEGWVTLLHKYLAGALSRRFGRTNVINIWRDTNEIGGSTYFDEAIETSIKESAIFLALTSNGYLSSESYCSKELKCFYQKAQQERYGLKIGTRARLFNLLVQNIAREKWPAELIGTAGLAFHDAEDEAQFGEPSEPGSPLFESQLRKLVDELHQALLEFKAVIQPVAEEKEPTPEEVAEDSLTVFVAHAEGALRGTKRRVVEELRRSGVRVAASVPPPYEVQLHDRIATAEISSANLSVHLFDDAPGIEIEGEPEKSYYQKQAEIGLQHAKAQLIWVPKALDLQTIEDENYRGFLDQLENGRRGEATYSFIRESPGSITREILAKLNQLKIEKENPRPPLSATLLDTHQKDQPYAYDLGRFLYDQRGINAYVNPEEDDPQKNIALFQEMLRRVSVLVIVFGQVAGEWVRERVNTALQIAINQNFPLKLCGIYLTPSANGQEDNRPASLGRFRASVPIVPFYRPETLADLLDTVV
jgi:hypothetical protein